MKRKEEEKKIKIGVVTSVVAAVSSNILQQAVSVASVKTLEKLEYQANDSGTKSTIFGSTRV